MDIKLPEKMTAAEQQAEKQRKQDLAAEIERMDDVELRMLAVRIKVPEVDKLTARKELVDAVESKAEADAALGRQAIRDMEAEEDGKVSSEDARRPATSRILRALNAEFCRDIPQEGRGGHFDPGDDHPRFGGSYDVPDGKYRVTGSEWVFEIKKKKLAGALQASEANKYGGKGVIAVD
jgi:hypothetical protein